jgi:hypothetical protein
LQAELKFLGPGPAFEAGFFSYEYGSGRLSVPQNKLYGTVLVCVAD